MTRYSNLWTDGSSEVKSAAHPGEDFFPVYAKSRVRGDGYTPYEAKDGSRAWVAAANRAMANAARYNFETRS